MNLTTAQRALLNDVIALGARFSLAGIFYFSGRLKVDGWTQINESAIALFTDEYQLPFIAPLHAAILTATLEHLLPLLLVLGLGTRFAALGIMMMTAVIEYVYPASWPTHLSWAALGLYLMVHGPGRVALDRWFSQTKVNH